jgi:hypothetical protein
VKKTYWDESTSAIVLPANLPAALQTPLPVFIFGHIDYSSGFPAGFSKLPLPAPWKVIEILTIGVNATPTALIGNSVNGDIVIHYQAISAGVTYDAYVQVTSPNVGYSSLLEALSSDRFVINYIRYDVLDDSLVSQFLNQLVIITQTLFGRATDDKVSPNSFKDPSNQIRSLIDVPLSTGIDKNRSLSTYINYDVSEMIWSIFTKKVTKVRA